MKDGYQLIADVGRSCQLPPMSKTFTPLLCALVACVSSSAIAQTKVQPAKLRWIGGYLNAHWEYPGYLHD